VACAVGIRLGCDTGTLDLAVCGGGGAVTTVDAGEVEIDGGRQHHHA
jgi:hypothetical protein